MRETHYRAFISYSQKDKVWGARLHRWLEGYRLPAGVRSDMDATRRLGRFFRDVDEMPATADMTLRVRRSLELSEFLIVICSPRSARSKWVTAEIRYFRKLGRGQNIFAFIIDGEPNSRDPETECFPPAFRLADPSNPDLHALEPLGLDVRKDGRARVCARLAAGLLRVDFDELWQRDRRRNATRQRWWIGSLGTATVAFGSLAVAAVRFGLSARRSSQRAEAARANLLADTATRFLEKDNSAEALGYAAAALEIAQSVEGNADASARAERATRQALMAHQTANARLVVTYRGHSGRIRDVAISADRRLLATAGDDGMARIYDYNTGALLMEVDQQSPIVGILFFANNRYLLSAAKDGQVKATNIEGTGESFQASLGARLLGMRLTPAGDAVLLWGLSGTVALWHPLEDKLEEIKLEYNDSILNAQFLPDDLEAVFLEQGTKAALISLRECRQLTRFSGAPAGREIKRGLVSFVNNEGVEILDLPSGRVVCKIAAKGVLSSVIDAGADRVVVLGFRQLEFWSMDACTKIASQELSGSTKDIAKAGAGNSLVAWGEYGVSVFRLDDGELRFQIKPKFEVVDVDVSDAANRILLRGNDGQSGVWSLVDGVEVKLIESRAAIRDAKFSATGRSVWVGRESGELQIVALDEGAIDGCFFHEDAVLGWYLANENSEFLTWSADGTAKRWTWSPGNSGCFLSSPAFRADSIVVSQKASVCYSTHADRFSAWRLDNGQSIAQESIGVQIRNLVPSHDGQGAMLIGQGRMCAWNIENGEHACLDTAALNHAVPYGASSFALYDRDAKIVLTVDLARVGEGFLQIAENVVDAFVFGKSRSLAVCRENGEIEVYRSGTRTALTLSLGQNLASCTGDHNENRLVAVAVDGTITIFDLNDTLVSTSDVWSPPVSIPTEQMTQFHRVHSNRQVVFAGSGRRLIWLDPDNRRVIRDETTSHVLGWLNLADDSQNFVALRDRKGFALLFASTGGEPVKLEHRSNILGMHFLTGGSKVATWSADRMLKVWTASGVLKYELPHFGIVRGVGTTPEGDLLVTWTDQRDLTYWDIETGAKLFETRVSDVVREVSFLKSPERMLIVFEHAAPTCLPYVPRENLRKAASDLLSVLRPFSQSELQAFRHLEPDRNFGLQSARRGSTSKVAGHDFLSDWHGSVELAILRDGRPLIACDQPFKHILQLVEYNEFDQLLTLYGSDGSMATLALPIPPALLDAMRRHNQIVIYTLFPNHEPIGYQVPLTRQ